MCFQDVAFLHLQASFSTTFLKNCGKGEDLESTTCPIIVVQDKQEHAPCRIIIIIMLAPGNPNFCVSRISLRS